MSKVAKIVDRVGDVIVDHEKRKVELLRSIRWGVHLLWTWEAVRTTPHWWLNVMIYLLGGVMIFWPDIRRRFEIVSRGKAP